MYNLYENSYIKPNREDGMKKLLVISLMLVLMASLFADRKALVIGISQYDGISLSEASSDADSMAAALSNLGFATWKHKNLSLPSLTAAVDSFAVKIGPLDEVVVYFSGHGTNQNGVNYLAPAGLNLSTLQTYANTAYSLNTLANKVKNALSSLIIVEASRTWSSAGGKSGTKSLVSLSPAVGNQAILCSAQPGKGVAGPSGNLSLFTKVLIKQISSSQEGINTLFPKIVAEVKTTSKMVQQPWMSNIINTNFYFQKAQEKGIWKGMNPMEVEGGGSLNW